MTGANDYGLAFRLFRAAKNWTQGQSARRLKVGPSMLSLIESGRRTPSIDTLERAAAAFAVPLSMFVALATRDTEHVAVPLLEALVKRQRKRA